MPWRYKKLVQSRKASQEPDSNDTKIPYNDQGMFSSILKTDSWAKYVHCIF